MSVAARGALTICFACCLLLLASARAEMAYVYSGMGAGDDAGDYVSMLLQSALDRTVPAYGAYTLRRIPDLPRNRQIRDLESGSGEVTFAILGTANEAGAHLRPILIPIDKGIIGYRLLVIRRPLQQALSEVKSPDDLRRYSLGQNFAWDDVRVLRANGFHVQPGDTLDGLYQMLARKRFDAFPRGVSEIGVEFGQRIGGYPDLQIERDLLLYYPLPLYFWFGRSPKGEALAKRLEEGMWSMIDDGSMDALLRKHLRAAVEGLNLTRRRIITLVNPALPADTPLGDPRLWITPAQLDQFAGQH